MKTNALFYLGIFFVILFEWALVYFIMPMPGSQDMDSLDLAYFLHRWRWIFRTAGIAMILLGLRKGSWSRRWVPYFWIGLALIVAFVMNGKMAADRMFKQPEQLIMADRAANAVDVNRLIIGVVHNGEARAYPVRFLGYHHQVQDSLGGKPILVTYCTVCRTGRVFDPVVDGKREQFRLVGMDHFNAMIEDQSTGSWWRQATGDAVTGPRKGQQLKEVTSEQMQLGKWLMMYPGSKIMQADPASLSYYDTTLNYEKGRSRKKLTGTDSLSWGRKSWVIGLSHMGQERAYDWNRLLKEKQIADTLGGRPLLLLLSADSASFFAFEKPAGFADVQWENDTLILDGKRFLTTGRGLDTALQLTKVKAYQEFWHSWKTFHPSATKDQH